MHAGGLKGEILASALDRQWRLKRVLMRPEAAFPYVFAAEGAQHPPKKAQRSTPRRHKISRNLVITRSHNETAATLNTPRHEPHTATKKVRPKRISRTINPNYYDAKL